MLIGKKVWNHTTDQQCSKCGKLLPLSTVRAVTYISVADDDGGSCYCPTHRRSTIERHVGGAINWIDGLHQ